MLGLGGVKLSRVAAIGAVCAESGGAGDAGVDMPDDDGERDADAEDCCGGTGND